jgi:hypothetical protein
MFDAIIRWAFFACAIPSVIGVIYFLRLAERKRRACPEGFDIIRHSLRQLQKKDDRFLAEDPIAKELLIKGSIWIAAGFILFLVVFLVGIVIAAVSIVGDKT